MTATDWIPIISQIVALVALLVTLVSTRLTIAAQRDLKLTEIKADLFAKNRQSWNSEFRRMTSDLLVLCDPDYKPPSVAEANSRTRDILRAVHSLSLYLDPGDADHVKFERAVIRLGTEAQPKYASDRSGNAGLEASASVIEAAKIVLKKEMKWLEEQFRNEEPE